MKQRQPAEESQFFSNIWTDERFFFHLLETNEKTKNNKVVKLQMELKNEILKRKMNDLNSRETKSLTREHQTAFFSNFYHYRHLRFISTIHFHVREEKTSDAGSQYRCGRPTGGQGRPTTIHIPTPPPNKHVQRSFYHFSTHAHGPTDGPTDQRTDQRTDGRTDGQSHL